MIIKRLMSFLCLMFLVITTIGCTTGSSHYITGIEIDDSTFESEVVINEFDIRTWTLKEVYNDGGFKEVKVKYSMLSTEDIGKLGTIGTHTITFTHEGFSCDFEITITAPSEEDILEKLNLVSDQLVVPTTADKDFVLDTYKNNVSISWQSDSECIVITGSTATVSNKGTEDVTVTLTATLSYYDETIDKTFEVVVLGSEEVHIHIYVDGVCECGEKDPDYVPDDPIHGGIEYTGSYYDSTDLTLDDRELLLELRELLTETHDNIVSYNDLKTDIPKTDGDEANESLVLCIYSRYAVQGTWSSGGTIWNREHVWPKSLSWFNESGAGSDLHHLRPEDPSVNSARGNNKFGDFDGGSEVKTSGGKSTGCYLKNGYFEPVDEAKGDVARILFYLFTRYSEADNYQFTDVAESLEMLLEWNLLDPVDEWEMERNDVTEDIQGNRNPFIDHPELADIIWG